MGPCEGLESEEPYLDKIAQVKNLLKGNFRLVTSQMKEEMDALSMNMEFEKAQKLKDKISLFDDYQSKSKVVSQSVTDVDVFYMADDTKRVYVQYLKIIEVLMITESVKWIIPFN